MFADKISYRKKDRGGKEGVGVIVSMVIIFSSLVCECVTACRTREREGEQDEMNETPSSHDVGRKQFPRLNLVMQSLWASSAFGN